MRKKEQLNELLAEAEALIESIRYVYEIDSKRKDFYGFSSHVAFATRQKDLADKLLKVLPSAKVYTWDTSKILTSTNSIYTYRRNVFDGVLIELNKMKALIQSAIGQEAEEIETITQLIKSKLRSVTHSKPTKETEVQNNLENLLIARNYAKGIDYDRETGRVKTGVKESVPDFNLDRLSLCIEVKLLKDTSTPSKITEEINADITAYSKKYKTVLFVIYDAAGKIQNEEQFKTNIVNAGRVLIEIIKH